jgi:hypothetical protein
MGWGRTLLLGDIGNRLDIADAEQDIERLRRELSVSGQQNQELIQRIRMLEREQGELKLSLVALMRLLATKGTLDLSELRTMARAIDAEDGKVDGQYRAGR